MAEAALVEPSITSRAMPAEHPDPELPSKSATSEGSDDSSAEARDAATTDPASVPLLYIQDHGGRVYPIPCGEVRDFAQFKAIVEEIYVRRKEDERLDMIRNDQFDVVLGHRRGEAHLLLPSQWSNLVRPGMNVLISFWPDQDAHSTISEDAEVESVEFDVNIEDDTRKGPAFGRQSSDAGISTHSDSDETEESDSSTEDSEETEQSDSSTEDNEEASEHTPSQPIRVMIKPVDKEGNLLSIAIDTKWAMEHMASRKESDSSNGGLPKKPRSGREMSPETLRITKAITVSTENRTTMQVHTLPGPENATLSSSIVIRWFHMHGDQLDWEQFKNTCLTVPDLPERSQLLIKKTLHKIEKEHIKAFLDGRFIDPGTVLRGDECNQPDPDSVIFSCLPYFDIRKFLQHDGQTNHLHPPRTLMQSYYPFEPVRDRDEEQAYRKFGNARTDNLIHVPSLWMLNISGRAVVTAGYGPLSSGFTKSIEVVQEDIKQLGAGTGNSLTSVRLKHLDGRVLLYSPRECGTYFQMEQKIRELSLARSSWYEKSPRLLWQGHEQKVEVTAANWPIIVSQDNVIFVDISVVDIIDKKTAGTLSPIAHRGEPLPGLVPPFFHWPSASGKSESDTRPSSIDVKHAIRCLEQVEKALMGETLAEYDTRGLIDRTFTSTNYYESLPEDDNEHVDVSLHSQLPTQDSVAGQDHRTHHQFIVDAERSKLPSKAKDFVAIVRDTLNLFVGNVDESTMLRKVWGAMANVEAVVRKLHGQKPYDTDSKEYTDPSWKTAKTGTRSWRIRTPTTSYTYSTQGAAKFHLPLPADDREFGDAVKKCRRCAREKPFDSPNAALEHLRHHVAATEQGETASSSFLKDDNELKDWIRNDDQALLESTITGACTILDCGIEEASTIYKQLKELPDGVRNEHGELSALYTFPHKLIETLHRLIIFYFAVERSLYYTRVSFDQTRKGGHEEDYPYTDLGLEVMRRFSDGVKSPLLRSRVDLCEMVRSPVPNDYSERMSWGPESVSSWLMRRLIVKPLEKSMTVADMYREYLSTLQFQVNHRPGKRLLRSINLLQEELTILASVNTWQTRLVKKYMRVLDHTTYPTDIPTRRALFPLERLLLTSCLDNLALAREEYTDLIRRCGPLSERTKQSAEINEEDHGKAILVFTVVTVIFLPLSFVTSYLGMNTSDIRDMDSPQTLFWEIALPLTVGVMAIMLAIAYNGDAMRDVAAAVWRSLAGKQDRNRAARGIGVMQRHRAAGTEADSSGALSLADDAEYAPPRRRPDYALEGPGYPTYAKWNRLKKATEVYKSDDAAVEPVSVKLLRADRARNTRARSTHDVVRIHRKDVVPSVLDDEGLDWDYDRADRNYVIIQGHLDEWETESLVAKSRAVREGWDRNVRVGGGRIPQDRSLPVGGVRNPREVRRVRSRSENLWGDVSRGRRSEYVWLSKREKRRMEKGRGRYHEYPV